MGLPATMSVVHPSLLGSHTPYRFGASAPHHPQYSSAHDLARHAQTLRDAAAWWTGPRSRHVAGFSTIQGMTLGAPTYPYPPVQLPYQHYPVPPLGAIHNTRCATLPAVSAMSLDAAPKPVLNAHCVHVVCNAPLLAPKPLPYHSPTFLQFDLPDDDEDLSHPPYVSRPHKRKREDDDNDDTTAAAAQEPVTTKRRVTIPPPKRRSSAMCHAAPLGSSGMRCR